MNAKAIICFLLLASTVSSKAFLTASFPGWSKLTKSSPVVAVVRCTKSPEWMRATNGVVIMNPSRGIVRSEVEVVSLLKGDRIRVKPGAAVLLESQCWPLQGENYLVFVNYCDEKTWQALETYRVAPLGHFFQTNMLAGKSLEENLQTLLDYSAGHLGEEIKRDQAEKARLEQGMNPKAATNPTNASPHLDMPLKKP